MSEKDFSIEEAFQNLEEMIEKLEDANLNLSESMEIYKKGMSLLTQCNEALDRTDKELIIIQEDLRNAISEGTDHSEGE